MSYTNAVLKLYFCLFPLIEQRGQLNRKKNYQNTRKAKTLRSAVDKIMQNKLDLIKQIEQFPTHTDNWSRNGKFHFILIF